MAKIDTSAQINKPKITGLAFFTFIIMVKFYLTCFKNVPLDKTSVCVLICLIYVTLFRTKGAWILGIGISLYGFVHSQISRLQTCLVG